MLETNEKLDILKEEKTKTRNQADKKAVDKLHKSGKLTARERIDALMDRGTFTEINAWAMTRFTDFGLDQKKTYGDGIVTGFGMINSRFGRKGNTFIL